MAKNSKNILHNRGPVWLCMLRQGEDAMLLFWHCSIFFIIEQMSELVKYMSEQSEDTEAKKKEIKKRNQFLSVSTFLARHFSGGPGVGKNI